MTSDTAFRLGSYVALLAVIFAVSWAIGQWAGPFDSEKPSPPAHPASEHATEDAS